LTADHRRSWTSIAAALALATAAGCSSPASGTIETAAEPAFKDAVSQLASGNGMSANGMSVNGMSVNGMSVNGMSVNGFTPVAFATGAFGSWFNGDVATRSVLMKYLVRCALATGRSYTWTNPSTRVAYTWAGSLGLAPGWTSGAPISKAEQELVSACLAAHVNEFGLAIDIAVEGTDATGATLLRSYDELWQYPNQEGCFFGNLFTGEGIFAGIDHGDWGPSNSTKRGCVFDYSAIGTARDCPPLRVVGVCNQLCQPNTEGTGYTTCTYGGKTFRALTTRIANSTLNFCGDGKCDPGERCGASYTYGACQWDCGPCK
jgi:hypothetical protein